MLQPRRPPRRVDVACPRLPARWVFTLNPKLALLDFLEARGFYLRKAFPGEAPNTLRRDQLRELRRLGRDRSTGRKATTLLGPRLEYFGGPALEFLVAEVWCREIYRFQASGDRPRVLDCGANIGLATLYVKRLYPNARVTAFEADPTVFDALRENVRSFGHGDVDLVDRAVWTDETELSFSTDAASTAGRIVGGGGQTILVRTTTLAPYLEEPIDFLKMDIEGAEVDVLTGVAPQLPNVRVLFVEFHSQPGHPQRLHELLAVLAGAGFRLFVEQGGNPVRCPLADRPEHKGFDLLLNIFATRD